MSTPGAPHRTVLTAEFDDVERARRVERSVRPEVGAIDGDRTTATLDRADDVLTVTVRASDLVALRAGINTWLTLLSVAEAAGGAETQEY
ncbi:KEOPS complex subunit Pcc1 [Halomicroarcula sp. GCM10025324]|uniref:KEOPS complex subunit Pcc1 n=1 Tax=Haloarcula TaxID=2237 RepID=UPI0023E8FAC9|nr:KEOPS complex subunit Pcc1 [Halomicroarcula sp. ZS-22-S1]